MENSTHQAGIDPTTEYAGEPANIETTECDSIDRNSALLPVVLDSVTHPLYVIDVDSYRVHLMNRAAREMCRSDAATCYALSHRTDAPCHTEDHPCPLEIIRQTRKPVVVEHVHYDRDDTPRHVEVHGFPILDKAGNVVQIIEYCVDITERKRTEESLRRYQLLANNSRDIILLMRFDDGRILEANAAAINAYGYSREELLARTVHDLRTDVGRDLAVDQMARADAEGILFEAVHRRKDGSAFPVEVSSQGATVGGTRTLVSVIRDVTERKQSQQALHESQERFRILAEATFEGVCISEHARIVDCNDQFARMLGYEREELLGRWLGDFISPDMREAVIDNIRQGREAFVEHEIVCKGGERRIVEGHGKSIRDKGRPVRITVVHDITERKKAEQALRNSEQRFRAVLENSLDVAYRRDLQSDRYDYISPVAEQVMGFTSQEMTELPIEAILGRIHPEDIGRVNEELAEALTRGHGTVEYRFRRKDGQYRWLSDYLVVQKDAAGRPMYRSGTVRDVTVRRALEERLQQLNEQLEEQVAVRTEQLTAAVEQLRGEVQRRATAERELHTRSQILEGFFQHTIAPLAFLDREFNFVRVNEAYARADGKSPEYFVGKNHFELYRDGENRVIFEQVVQTKQPYRAYAKPFVYPGSPHRGVTYWNWQLTPLLDEAGNVQFLVLNLEDVTEQEEAILELKRRSHQLQQLAMELSQAEDRERKRLAEILHDDLQQLLAAAKFHVGMLGNRVKTDEGLWDMIGQIKDLLVEAISKSRSLSHELSPPALAQSDLWELFTWMAEQMKAKHGLAVHMDCPSRIDVASEALKAFLYKTVQEMLFNVVKHAGVKDARLRLRRVRGNIWVCVSDDGRGFDPQELGRTAGFGLLSVRERIELLGGRMRMKSAPGKGSIFVISVPDPGMRPVPVKQARETAEAAPVSPPRRKRAKHPIPQRLRVLLADDHKVMREGLAIMLDEEQDIEIVGQAANGRDAVDLAHQLAPDVVIMDVSMPVMQGDEATRRIKEHMPSTRVIALSMFEEPHVARRMRRAGAETYLSKTGPAEQLLAAIRGR